jgi:hypothetical protein
MPADGPEDTARDVALPRRTILAAAAGGLASGPLWAQAIKQAAPPVRSDTNIPSESVARFGTVGDGRSPAADQVGLADAVRAVNRSGRYVAGIGESYWGHPQDGLFIPAGVYDAGDLKVAGNTAPFSALSIWAIPGSVVIRIPDGQYLFETSERLNWLYVFGITFVGGKGAFQHRFTGANVNGRFVFERCVFDNYTECAIGNNAIDQPYLEVRGCTFMAAPKSRAIGIAWGGYADGSVIESNAFLRNRYHVKLGPDPSGSVHIARNDFLRWDRDTALDAAIWLVPATRVGRFDTNAGWGTIISGNKFGNENMAPHDIRLLVAREGAGANRQTRAHMEKFDAGGGSGAFLAGVTIENNRVAATAATASPFMRSWIAEVRNLSYLNNRHDGGLHSWLCEFMGTRSSDYANLNWTVRLDNAGSVLGSSPFALGVSNALIGPQWDPGATEGLAEETMLFGAGGDDTSFVSLAVADRSDAFTATGKDVMLRPVPDHNGHLRAIDVGGSPQSGIYGLLSGTVAQRMSWIALDLRHGTGAGGKAITVRIFNPATGVTARQLRYNLPSDWRRVRVPFTLPASTKPDGWQFLIQGADSQAPTSFQVARLYVYHGREPKPDAHVTTLGDGKWDGSHIVLGRTHLWEEADALYMKSDGPPNGPTDGKRLG